MYRNLFAVCLFAAAGSPLAITSSANAAEREVQIRSIDFSDGVVELFNFSAANIDLTGWRFCSHDFDQNRNYTHATGFTGVTIEAGTSVFIHFNDDAPVADPDRINRSTLGGFFASPLDQDAYGIQLFFPATNGNVSFNNSALIADHMQWNIFGAGVGSAEFRTAQAVSEGLWTANGDFIATAPDSVRIELIDLSGGISQGPTDYNTVGPPGCSADFDADSEIDGSDLALLLAQWGMCV